MKRILCAVFLVLTLAWIGFIFSNSLDSGTESSQKSGSVHKVVNEVAQSLGATEEISEATIRTSAHFSEFALLGILVCADILLLVPRDMRSKPSRRDLLLLTALPFCILMAILDEILQKFSPGRAMQFIDVAVDSAGALCGVLLFSAVFFTVRAARRKRTLQN